jgi:hypothetical protein
MAGWIQTFPNTVGGEVIDTCDAVAGQEAFGYAFSASSGSDETGNDFGNFEEITKSGTKFEDVNGDGDLTDGVALDGWTINLYADDGDTPGELDASDAWLDDAITGAGDWPDGYYEFPDLGPGDYIVCEESMAGWIQTFPNTVGGEVIDTCDAVAGQEAFGYAFSASSGTDETGNDFGNFEPSVFEGCTPGFWKTHLDAWEATVYDPDQLVGSVFTLPASLSSLADDTLLEALNYHGGKGELGAAQILLRAAVAAILNASHPDVDYEFALADIIADVNAALDGNRAGMLALAADLDAANNAGCPLGDDTVVVTAQVTLGLAFLPVAGAVAGVARRRRRTV